MNKHDIKELLKYGDRLFLERKKSTNEISKSVWETYSAFANTSGGIILLGIEENLNEPNPEHRFHINGISNPEKRLKEFWDTINSNKVSSNILMDRHVSCIEVDGVTIMCIEVPQADYHKKPIYINDNPLKGTYKRNHEGDYHCSEDEIKAMIRDSSDDGNDGRLLEGFTMEDIDQATLKAYRTLFEHNNPNHVWSQLDDQMFLRNIGGYTIDRIQKKEGLSAAGLLMFGNGLAIREAFEHINMDYLDLQNANNEQRWSDRITYDGTWENNLFNFSNKIISKLSTDLKKPFQLKGYTRIDDTNVHKAVRESVINMLIHADYQRSGILKVVKYDHGFLLSNPGSLKLPISTIYEGGNSISRNPRIQKMFRLIGLGDNIGSGFPTILDVWIKQNWRTPDLYDNQEIHQVELRLWMMPHLNDSIELSLYQLFKEEYQSLSKDEQIILATVYLENKITQKRLETILFKDSFTIGKLLSQLVKKKCLSPNSMEKLISMY